MRNNLFFVIVFFSFISSSIGAVEDFGIERSHFYSIPSISAESQYPQIYQPQGSYTQLSLEHNANPHRFEHYCQTSSSPSGICIILPATTAIIAMGSTAIGCVAWDVSKKVAAMRQPSTSRLSRAILATSQYSLQALAVGCCVVGSCSAYATGELSIDLYRRMNS